MKKIDINKQQKISSEEIAKGKNFGAIMSNYKKQTIQPKQTFTKNKLFLSGIALLGAAVAMVLFFMQNESPKQQKKKVLIEQTQSENTNPMLEIEEKPHKKEDPFINPPIKGVDVEYKVFVVDAGKATELEYKTGTKLMIPKNAFVDKRGEKIKGKVELKYREFHDVADFFVSGIPMTYDSAGTEYTFESAGMVELLGTQNREEVFVNPKEPIRVEMASNYESSKYNLYYLDEKNREWDYEGKDEVIVKNEEIYTDDEDFSAGFTDQEIFPIDETYSYIKNKEIGKKRIELAEIQKDIELYIKEEEPVKPKKLNKEKYTFNIDVDEKEFPEITAFENLQFEVDESNTNFTSEFYQVTWDKAEIKKQDKKMQYLLILGKGGRRERVSVTPVYEGKGYEDALAQFNLDFATYQEKLEEKKEEEQRKKEEVAILQKKLEEERKKQEELWAERRKKLEKSYSTEQKIIRAFDVKYFGTWNCDSPVPQPAGAQIMASMKDENQQPIESFANNFKLMEKNKNAMFSYYGSAVIEKLKYSPRETNTLWTVVDGNKIAIVKPEQFKEIAKGAKKHEFAMELISKEITSVDQVKELLNL